MIASTCRPTKSSVSPRISASFERGYFDGEMLLRQKLCITYNHPLKFAELPSGCAGIGHSIALTINPQTIMVERRDVGKRRSRY